jgi:hypothetical protein
MGWWYIENLFIRRLSLERYRFYIMKKISAILLTIVMMISATVPVFAKVVKDDPYGFIWLDEKEDIFFIQYYEYNEKETAYEITDYVYVVDGTKLYDKNGKQIETILEMTDTANPTVVFDEAGELYFLLSKTSVGNMEESTDKTYSKATISSVKNFTVDNDTLGTKAGSKNLSSLSFSGNHSRVTSSDTGTTKSGDYVLTYAYNGDPLKTAYDAYKDDELVLTVYCKNSNVWNETHKKLLSDTCVGAKFVGFSSEYSIILYDLDGTLYYFLYDEYDRAYTISLGEEIMYFTRDEDGFIKSITTSKKTYELDAIIDEHSTSATYVENSSIKSVAYDEDDKAVATLKKSSNYLYWNDSKLNKSYKPTYFGITEEGLPVWINSSGNLYYYNGNTETLIESEVTRIQYDSDGFAYRYYIGTKAYTFEF